MDIHNYQMKGFNMKIIPVNEANGQGNGWQETTPETATGFEVDNGQEVVEFFDTYEQAQLFIKNHKDLQS